MKYQPTDPQGTFCEKVPNFGSRLGIPQVRVSIFQVHLDL